MSSVVMPTVPTLLTPKGLVPLKRFRKGRKARRAAQQRVRASEDEAKGSTPPSPTDSVSGGAPSTRPTPKPLSATKTSATASAASTAKTVGGRLFDAMKFRGGAPELINGRCAMVAIPTVIGYELATKESFLQLLADHKGLFAAVVGIIALASLIPIARGAKNEAFGFMTPSAELINGRAAMIGILGLILLEAKSGTNFF